MHLIVALPSKIFSDKCLHMIDDNGNEYEFKGVEHIRFAKEIPEWYMKMPFVLLDGINKEVGQYFAAVK